MLAASGAGDDRVHAEIGERVGALVAVIDRSWPRTQMPLDRGAGAAAASSACQRSALLHRLTAGGAPAAPLPAAAASSVMPFCTYCESVSTQSCTRQGRLSAPSASITATQFHAVVGGLRLPAEQFAVVRHANAATTPQPPGPGLPATGAVGVDVDHGSGIRPLRDRHRRCRSRPGASAHRGASRRR
jgi:hypothetical protein